jgi:hypothetical protein
MTSSPGWREPAAFWQAVHGVQVVTVWITRGDGRSG